MVDYSIEDQESGKNIIICPNCGYKIEKKGKGIVCPNCDTLNDFDANFCKNCGIDISDQKPSKFIPIKMNLDEKINYSIKTFGEDKYKIKTPDTEEIFNTILTRDDDSKNLIILKNRCPNCLHKITQEELRLMKRGYKIRCKHCDHTIN
ncbi:MAG: hypothetical protein EU551_00345 [Promethearchaeota archaeon]|nr:MAG: hypothetical protein EU551_00345 [Candidatus Lokiarchaeota archaeon]